MPLMQSSLSSDEFTVILSDASSATLIKMFCGYSSTPNELAFTDAQCYEIEQYICRLSFLSIPSRDNNVESDDSGLMNHIAVGMCTCYGIWAYRALILRSNPPDTATCVRMGENLRAALLQTSVVQHWYKKDRFSLLLWITFMGVHTTCSGALRQWYVALLRGLSTYNGKVMPWEKAQETLSKFLWIELCNMPGRKVWDEVESTNEFTPLLEFGNFGKLGDLHSKIDQSLSM